MAIKGERHLPELDKAREQLQELYRHLDCSPQSRGDRHLAYYGQLRAQETSHAEALAETVKYFNLDREGWYQVRFKEKR